MAGRRARPPEDCGGTWGYTVMQEILTDPGHPDHVETLRFLCLPSADAFDAAQFDLDAVNAALASQATAPAPQASAPVMMTRGHSGPRGCREVRPRSSGA
jgi:hypothetical protein